MHPDWHPQPVAHDLEAASDGESGEVVTLLNNLAQAYVRLGRPRQALATSYEAFALDVPDQGPSDMIESILFHAEVLVAHGDIERGVAYLGALRSHPMLGGLDAEVRKAIDRLEAADVQDLARRLDAGRSLELDDIVDEIRRRAELA